MLTVSVAPGASGALEAGGVGNCISAHSNKHLSISGGGVSMADAPGGDGVRRSSRTRRPASVEEEDFVDPIEVDRRSRAASSKQGQSREIGCASCQRAGEARDRRREQER